MRVGSTYIGGRARYHGKEAVIVKVSANYPGLFQIRLATGALVWASVGHDRDFHLEQVAPSWAKGAN